MDSEKRDFIAFVGAKGELSFLNLAQIQKAKFEQEKCEVQFHGGNVERIDGEVVPFLKKRLADRAMELDGSPIRGTGNLKSSPSASSADPEPSQHS